ncbi:hypothetical protein TSMEX_008859, partial [Taenia solium]
FRCVECDLRADCIIKIEVDCPLTGGSGGIGSASVVAGGGGGAPADRHQSSGLRAAVSRKAYSHLMCADSEVEMESWVKGLNGMLEAPQHWVPEHFARVARYDSGLIFTQPVAASVASRLKQW